MRNLIANIMVFCLLIISVHTAAGGEHSPIHDPSTDVQEQSILAVIVDDRKNPSDEQKINSECSICHAGHILLVFASSGTEFKLFNGEQMHADFEAIHTSRNDDITHPPIILI